MTAVVTKKLKKQLLDTLKGEVDNASIKYYIGVGRSETWDSSDTPITKSANHETSEHDRQQPQNKKDTRKT